MYWTPKVESRGRLAAALKARAATVPLTRLKLSDLDALIAHADAAKAADQAQQAQLAAHSVERSRRAAESAAVAAFDRELRDLAPAVIADLAAAGRTNDADLLQRVTFARFRQRELQPPPGDTAPPEASELVRQFTRVERDDALSRARGVAGYCGFVLAPEREAIAAAFAERSLSRTALEAMKTRAEALVAAGANLPSAAEATQREHDAVVAQQRVWSAVRRLVRAAVQDDPTLSVLYASC